MTIKAKNIQPSNSSRLRPMSDINIKARINCGKALRKLLSMPGILAAKLKNQLINHIWYPASRVELDSLDCRTLKDLGINSNDFDAINSGNFSLDPTRRQRGISPHQQREKP